MKKTAAPVGEAVSQNTSNVTGSENGRASDEANRAGRRAMLSAIEACPAARVTKLGISH
jgi:hypothetical protein